jgi:hypothetical protein
MINKKHLFKTNITNKAGFVLGAVLLTALANGVSSANGQGVGVTVTAPVVVVPAVVAQDNYVYYPSYGTYYNSSQKQYAYMNNGAWVTTPMPFGVTADVLQASPSVRMDWHDSPEKHHAEMQKQYPKDWKSSGERHDQDGDRKAVTPDGDKRTPGQTRPPNN